MTVEEIRSAMKRVRKYPFSSTKPVCKLFENPKKLQPIIISACSTAKMNCIVGNVLSTDRTSYNRTFHFLDDQAAFNLDFGVNPIPFTLFSSHKVAKEDSVHISQKIRINVNTCQVILVCDIVEKQYGVTSNYDSRNMLLNITDALFKLKLDVTGRGKESCRTPDDLFCDYMDYIPFLLAAVDHQGFHLPLLFFKFSPWIQSITLLSIRIKAQTQQLSPRSLANNKFCQYYGKQQSMVK